MVRLYTTDGSGSGGVAGLTLVVALLLGRAVLVKAATLAAAVAVLGLLPLPVPLSAALTAAVALVELLGVGVPACVRVVIAVAETELAPDADAEAVLEFDPELV
jgi:uncharacterized membrane protein YjfL (UPF0719 family)